MDRRSENELFLEYLERMVQITHESNDYDREAYVQLIHEICETYHLAKGVVGFYLNAEREQKDDGDFFCDFDNGRGEKEVIRIRIEARSKAIILGMIYMAEEDELESPEAKEHLEMLLRVILGFVSRRRLQQKLEEFAFSDEMGFRNFRSFARYLITANKNNALGGKVAILFDLHNFTMVNQEIGRPNGDAVLRRFYNMVMDVIGDGGTLSRLGGDKFIGIFDRKDKRQIFEILSGVPVVYDERGMKRIRVSASAGVFMIPNPYMMKSVGDIMDRIMVPSQVAKRQTEGAIVIFDEKMKSEKDRVKRVQKDFWFGLEQEEFKVFYQPKVNVETGEISGAEALCRWYKNGKIIPPMEFIPILEMNTDICDLDFYMLDHVCGDIRRWLDQGQKVVRISVNLSRKHLVDVDLLDHIMTIIDKHHVPHEYIEVELTETTTDVLFRDLKRVVSGLQELGVRTAVDDFGMGYSSLNLIRDIPWDVIKIDKSFVPKSDEAENKTALLMFKHVSSLAQDLGMECVVEGVETVEQLGILRNNHCCIAQGYFFDKPLPVEEFEARMNRQYYPIPEDEMQPEEQEQSE